jgi:hypothetical protein
MAKLHESESYTHASFENRSVGDWWGTQVRGPAPSPKYTTCI